MGREPTFRHCCAKPGLFLSATLCFRLLTQSHPLCEGSTTPRAPLRITQQLRLWAPGPCSGEAEQHQVQQTGFPLCAGMISSGCLWAHWEG
jgi:hypothetical protein